MERMAFRFGTTQPDFPERYKLYGRYQKFFELDAKWRVWRPRTGLECTFDFGDVSVETRAIPWFVGALFFISRRIMPLAFF
ncbi:MAG: hypothetical protein H0X47_07265 [Nitrospirales bacterium]|nr:hypothetical protein [Nitrospirales bacterium]